MNLTGTFLIILFKHKGHIIISLWRMRSFRNTINNKNNFSLFLWIIYLKLNIFLKIYYVSTTNLNLFQIIILPWLLIFIFLSLYNQFVYTVILFIALLLLKLLIQRLYSNSKLRIFKIVNRAIVKNNFSF